MVRLSKSDKKLIELWYESCVEMATEQENYPSGIGCDGCEFQDACRELRIKLFGSTENSKFRFKDDKY